MEHDEWRPGAPDLVADLELVGRDGRHSALRLAFDGGLRRELHAQVVAPEVQERWHALAIRRQAVDATDEEIVIARGERLGDGAFDRRNGAVEQRQARRPRVPGRAAEVLPT